MIRIKICGITNLADAKAATDAGANSLGFNFLREEPSPYRYPPCCANSLKLPKEVEAVGVFVNAKPADIRPLRAFVRFDARSFTVTKLPTSFHGVASSSGYQKRFA